MLLNYSECEHKYGNAYQIDRALRNKQLFKIEKGLYSDTERYSELSAIAKKYPKGVFTGEYAFYYHALTDLTPERYSLATPSKSARIADRRVLQVYVRDDLLPLGVTEVEIDGDKIKIYDKERMLIELLRNKPSIPYDLYKEVLLNYRKIVDSLEIWRIQEYAAVFPKSKAIARALDMEVW